MPTSSSSLFLYTIKHMNTMKLLVSLGRQWIAIELKEFREFKTQTYGSSFAGKLIAALNLLVSKTLGHECLCSFRRHALFVLPSFDLTSQPSSSALLRSGRECFNSRHYKVKSSLPFTVQNTNVTVSGAVQLCYNWAWLSLLC